MLIALLALLGARLLSQPAATTTDNLSWDPVGNTAHDLLNPSLWLHHLPSSVHHILPRDKCIQWYHLTNQKKFANSEKSHHCLGGAFHLQIHRRLFQIVLLLRVTYTYRDAIFKCQVWNCCKKEWRFDQGCNLKTINRFVSQKEIAILITG